MDSFNVLVSNLERIGVVVIWLLLLLQLDVLSSPSNHKITRQPIIKGKKQEVRAQKNRPFLNAAKLDRGVAVDQEEAVRGQE